MNKGVIFGSAATAVSGLAFGAFMLASGAEGCDEARTKSNKAAMDVATSQAISGRVDTSLLVKENETFATVIRECGAPFLR